MRDIQIEYITVLNVVDLTNPLGLAKRCLLGDGRIVPVDDAEEAEEAELESSSGASGSGFRSSISSSSSFSTKWLGGGGGSKGRPASLARAKDRCKSLIVYDDR